MYVCVFMYMPLCDCLLLVLTEQMTSLRTLSFGKERLISPASLIWSLERPLGFRISEKTKKSNLMRRMHIIKYKTHYLPPPAISLVILLLFFYDCICSISVTFHSQFLFIFLIVPKGTPFLFQLITLHLISVAIFAQSTSILIILYSLHILCLHQSCQLL